MGEASMGQMRVQITVDPLVAVFAVLYALAGSLWQWAAVFASLIVHEVAHAVVAAGFGLRVAEVRITPIGAAVRIDGGIELRAEAEAAVAMAGPMTSLVLAGASYILLTYGKPDIVKTEFFIGANVVLALLNLVPAYPLDGGRVLRALLAERMGTSRATRGGPVKVDRRAGDPGGRGRGGDRSHEPAGDGHGRAYLD
jgi:stage IV sporulation protein FB